MTVFLRLSTLSMLFVLGILSIIASGGGSDDILLAPPPIPGSPSGYYSGRFTSTDSGFPIDAPVVGIVSEDLDAHILGSELLYVGMVATSAEVLSGTLTQYLGRTRRFFGVDGTSEISLDGSIDATGLSGDYAGPDDQGSFDLVYSSAYEQASSLEQTSGVWTLTEAAAGNPLYILTITIDADGDLFGSDTSGCVYSGEVSLIDERFNAYAVAIGLTSCGVFDGDYTGLAHLFDTPSASSAIRLSFANSDFAFWGALQK